MGFREPHRRLLWPGKLSPLSCRLTTHKKLAPTRTQPLKQHLKHVLLVAAQEDLLGGGGDDSETTSSGGEGAANGDHLLANGNGSQTHSFKPSAGQVADFQRRIKGVCESRRCVGRNCRLRALTFFPACLLDGLESPAQLAERLCAEMTTEMGSLRPCRDGVEDERLPVSGRAKVAAASLASVFDCRCTSRRSLFL